MPNAALEFVLSAKHVAGVCTKDVAPALWQSPAGDGWAERSRVEGLASETANRRLCSHQVLRVYASLTASKLSLTPLRITTTTTTTTTPNDCNLLTQGLGQQSAIIRSSSSSGSPGEAEGGSSEVRPRAQGLISIPHAQCEHLVFIKMPCWLEGWLVDGPLHHGRRTACSGNRAPSSVAGVAIQRLRGSRFPSIAGFLVRTARWSFEQC